MKGGGRAKGVKEELYENDSKSDRPRRRIKEIWRVRHDLVSKESNVSHSQLICFEIYLNRKWISMKNSRK
jgi:hypothetical protein